MQVAPARKKSVATRGNLLTLCLLAVAFFVGAFPATLRAQGTARLWRDQVEPHWFAENTRFWYQVELPDRRREFLVVNAATGTREPAFDHNQLATALSDALQRTVNALQLPIKSLEFLPEGGKIRLTGDDGGLYLWEPDAKALQVERAPNPSAAGTKLFLPARPSRNGGQPAAIRVRNALPEPVEVIWVDPSGNQRVYGTIEPQNEWSQSTYEGHSWLFQFEPKRAIGCLMVEGPMLSVELTEETLQNVRQTESEPPRGRTRQTGNRNARRPAVSRLRHPSGEFEVLVQNDNLHLHYLEDSGETPAGTILPLTSDASTEQSFRRDASRARLVSMQFGLEDYPDDIPHAFWSPAGDYLLAFQTSQVPERHVEYIESSPKDQLQPKLQSYPYAKPGDPIPVSRPRLFRISDRQEISLSSELFPNAFELRFLRWSEAGDRAYFLYNQRGHQVLRLLELELQSGRINVVIDEQSDTFIHYSAGGKFVLEWLNDQTVLWASERSGWNHLYRYDLNPSDEPRAVTQGNWNVKRIVEIDQEAGVIWFLAVGVVDNQDPYHEHFCRVNLDGSSFQILTEGDGTHSISWSPDRQHFIDTYSRVDLPPVNELRRSADGRLICLLERAEVQRADAEGNERPPRFPDRFVAKGRDGKTDIWGIIHWPDDHDPSKSYPVIENIYAGPHDQHVPKAFRLSYGHQQRIADAGFVVVQIDGMGTAWRSKAFHDVCFRNLRDAGFPDRIAWIQALAEKHPELDLSRVGIYGGSAGGQNAMAALLWHHDFYRVAVADCGCHDNRMDKIWWNEQWMGEVGDGQHYRDNSNMENAHLLEGQLMLVVGELDRNVDPATTLQVVGRLIAANKDFVYLPIVGAGHGACESPYGSRRRLEFFQSHLQGQSAEPTARPAPSE